jgi:phosphate-selective porin OprO/OprP
MKAAPKLLALAVLAALSTPALAETSFDVIGGSEISFEGLLQADFYKYDNDRTNLNASIGDGDDTDFGLRRAELVFKGKGPGMWNWVVGYDAKADKFLDVNVQYKFSSSTYVRVGQFKQPNSLEELGSTKNNDFIPKAMTTNLQGIARRLGVAAGTGADNWSITGSAFTRELTRNLGEGNGFGARATWAPVLEPGSFLHLGVSLMDLEARDPGSAPGAVPEFDGDGRARFRVRTGADLTPIRLIDSGQFTDAERIRTIGLEGAWVHGPIKLQSEYMRTDVGRELHDDYGFDSWYVSGLWNITGETWGYKDAVVTTPLPSDPNRGLWQVGLRYEHADLDDGSFTPPSTVDGVLGGKANVLTVGVNWYWRSNFKFALNYVQVKSEKYNAVAKDFLDDDPSILELRAQVYW